MQTVELGALRLHLLSVHPGVSGEADRVARELARLDPGAVLVDLDTEDGLRAAEALAPQGPRFVPGFVDDLFQRESRRRFGAGVSPEDHPMLAAARSARSHRAAFVALRPVAAGRPGWFARRAARRAVESAAPGASEPEAFVRAFSATLAARGLFDPVQDVRAMMPRLESALSEAAAPLVVVVQAHRAEAFERAVMQMPRRSLA